MLLRVLFLYGLMLMAGAVSSQPAGGLPADIAAADLAHIAGAGRVREEQAERNRSQQIAERQRDQDCLRLPHARDDASL